MVRSSCTRKQFLQAGGGQSAGSVLYTLLLYTFCFWQQGARASSISGPSTSTRRIANDQRRRLLAPEIAPGTRLGWLIALMVALLIAPPTATHSATKPSSEPEPFGLAEVIKLSRVAGIATGAPRIDSIHRFARRAPGGRADCRGHVVMLLGHWLHQFCNCCRRASRGRQKGLRMVMHVVLSRKRCAIVTAGLHGRLQPTHEHAQCTSPAR